MSDSLWFLLRRYDREYREGRRAALERVVASDSPASNPMTLCVSAVIHPTNPEHLPQLEVSDGWYRIRATIDEPLARAVRKGTIRVGRKIAIAGAQASNLGGF